MVTKSGVVRSQSRKVYDFNIPVLTRVYYFAMWLKNTGILFNGHGYILVQLDKIYDITSLGPRVIENLHISRTNIY